MCKKAVFAQQTARMEEKAGANSQNGGKGRSKQQNGGLKGQDAVAAELRS